MIDLHKVSPEELDKFGTQVCQAVQFLTSWCTGGIYNVSGIPTEIHEWKLPYTNICIRSVIDLTDKTYMFYAWEEDAPNDAQYVQWILEKKTTMKFLCCSGDASLMIRALNTLDVVKPLRYNELEAIPVYGSDYINSL